MNMRELGREHVMRLPLESASRIFTTRGSWYRFEVPCARSAMSDSECVACCAGISAFSSVCSPDARWCEDSQEEQAARRA